MRRLMRISMPALCGLVVAWSLLAARPASANESMRSTMRRVAEAVRDLLAARSVESISVGQITGPPTFGTSAGAGLRKLLVEELEKMGVRERRVGSQIGVKGEYTKSGSVVRLQMALVDGNGEILSSFAGRVEVTGEFGQREDVNVDEGTFDVNTRATDDVLAELLGANVDFDARVDGDRIDRSFENPTAVIVARGGVKASARSPFSVYFLVNGQPRAVELEDGQPFIDLRIGEVFEIAVRNDAPFDASVRFHLDGLNSFAFSEIRHTEGEKRGDPRFSRFILGRGRSMVLRGWHLNEREVEQFKITTLAEGKAASLGRTDGVGTITVTFRATWPTSQSPPGDEFPKVAAAPALADTFGLGSAPEPAKSIGGGERIRDRSREDREDRQYGRPRAVVSIRYVKN